MRETGRAGRVTGTQGRPPAVITIARQHGARGAAVARLVAERLGYACWDRELVTAIAGQLRVDPSAMTAFDEHRGSGPAGSADDGLGERTSSMWQPSHADYVSGLNQVAQTIARRGASVVVGRGLAFLLDPEACLRVRVICPLEQRIACLVEHAKLCPETARATIDYVDRERQTFVREVHGKDTEDPSSYDLLISTGAMTVDVAADVIVAAYQARFSPRPRARSTPQPWARALPRTTTGVRRGR